MDRFTLESNDFLQRNVTGFFNCYYTGYGKVGNPHFLNHLKNTFNDIDITILDSAKRIVSDIIVADVPVIMRMCEVQNCTMVAIPRAKALNTYTPLQLFFRDAVSEAARRLPGVVDGTGCIVRHTNTRTTHLRKDVGRVAKFGRVDVNDGDEPYPGITKNTCFIDSSLINKRTVILVDDIYTKTCNVDEDCVQALMDNGAAKVLFYAIAYTRRN